MSRCCSPGSLDGLQFVPMAIVAGSDDVQASPDAEVLVLTAGCLRRLGLGSAYLERKDPKLRPRDAVPVEFVLLSYPLLDLPALPERAEGDDGAGDVSEEQYLPG